MASLKKQKGSALIVIVIIIIIAIIGALGYVAWDHFVKKPVVVPAPKTTTQSIAPSPKSGIVILSTGDFNKYVSYESHFEFLFPKQIYDENACQATTTKRDNYGNTIQTDLHYGGSDGPVSVTVLVSGDEYIIVPDKTVVQSDAEGSDADGYIFKACNVFPTTIDIVNEAKTDEFGVKNIALETRSFIVKDAAGDSGALAAARDIFGDATGSVTWSPDSTESDRQDGSFVYTPNTHLTGGFGYKLWYYPNEKKVVFFNLGQSEFFQYPDGSNQYYDNIPSTFKFSTD